MLCLHPHCPMGTGLGNWDDVLGHPSLRIRPVDKPRFLAVLSTCNSLSGPSASSDTALLSSAGFKRILEACPCLYVQVGVRVSARAVVHLCEVTLGTRITSLNVCDAFDVQHPSKPPHYLFSPLVSGASGGDIMEALCSEVLENHGVPHMQDGSDGWPQWSNRSHVSLNQGEFHHLKLYGDILVPCAPHNLLISVKSEAARERFVVSGNRLESVGFGFFSDASEFWTVNRMSLLKRWGFVAVYMPSATLSNIISHLSASNTNNHNVNINGRPLYRDLRDFGGDIHRVAGRISSLI